MDALDEYSMTPLHMALINKHIDVAELLILKGADVNAVTEYGTTPLDLANINNDKDIVELLIRKGARK